MRFTIRSVMMAVAVVAVLCALPGPLVVLAVILAFPFVCLLAAQWMVKRGYRRASGFGFGIVAIAANVLYVVSCVAPDAYILTALVLGWPVIVLPATTGLGIPWVILSLRAANVERHANPAPGLLVFALTVLPVLTLATFWLLHLAFLEARPTLERLADQVAAGTVVGFPQRAGMFRIVDATLDRTSGNVALFIDSDPSGPDGLVRVRSGTPADFTRPIVGSNLNISLGGGWWYRDED